LAAEIRHAGLELHQFSEKAHIRCKFDEIYGLNEEDECGQEEVRWGCICLQKALKADVGPIVEGLLELGVKTIPPYGSVPGR
jgi:hypothetical protein